MNVVVTDVAGKEVQEAGKLVERSSLNGGGEVIPVLGPLHISVLVLVLYVEEPEGDDAEEEDDGTLDDQKSLPAEQKAHTDVYGGNQEVIDVLFDVHLTPALKADGRDPQHNAKVNHGDNHEKDDGVAEQTVFEATPFAQLPVLLDGKEVNVANIPVLQLSGMAVVVTVNPGPVGIRNGTEKRANEADGIVDLAFLEEGVVPAVMLNDENADEEKGVDGSQCQREPDGIVHTKVHRNPKRHKRTETAEQLANGPGGVGFLVFGDDRLPVLKTVVDLFFGATIDRTLHAL